MRRLATLLFTVLAASPALAQPQPYDQPYYQEPYADDASFYADINVSLTGSEVPDVSIFFDRLAPFGTWYDDPLYGFVFVPVEPSYVPYSNGHWRFTDYGWTWISNDQFGWATDHYGRWVWRNRWVWKPDTQWGPAWVQWRVSDHHVGWAPLGYDVNAYIPDTHWRFVPTDHLRSRDVSRYYVRNDIPRYIRDTRPIVRWNRHGSQRWVAGPDRDYLSRHSIRVNRDRYDLRDIGRLDRAERARADRRLQETRTRYRDRLRRESEVRPNLQRRRVEVERRQVQQATERRLRERRDTARVDQRQREAQQRQVEQARQRDQQQRQVEQARQRDQQQRQQVEQRRGRDQQQRARQQEQLDERRRQQQLRQPRDVGPRIDRNEQQRQRTEQQREQQRERQQREQQQREQQRRQQQQRPRIEQKTNDVEQRQKRQREAGQQREERREQAEKRRDDRKQDRDDRRDRR